MATVMVMVMMVVGIQQLRPNQADHHKDQRNKAPALL